MGGGGGNRGSPSKSCSMSLTPFGVTFAVSSPHLEPRQLRFDQIKNGVHEDNRVLVLPDVDQHADPETSLRVV